MPTLKAVLQDSSTLWTRLTVDWYDHKEREIEVVTATAVWLRYGLPAVSLRYVLIRDVRGDFAPQALLCTDDTLAPETILAYFMRRWQIEPTFQLVRTHLGVETQRQWSDKAIARTTPVLLGLFSLVTLLADTLIAKHGLSVRTSAWYTKSLPTFSDALALVRTHIWQSRTFQTSQSDHDMIKVPRLLFERFTDLLAYPA